jgi:hypothetical protein
MRVTSNRGFYRSGLEKKFAEMSPRGVFQYEPYKIPYVVYRDYIPDFVHEGAQKTYLIECKGYFRVGDTQKYKAIRDSVEDHIELVFLLSDKNKKVRKGSKMTMEQWCAKEGLACFTLDSMDKLLEYMGVSNGSDAS